LCDINIQYDLKSGLVFCEEMKFYKLDIPKEKSELDLLHYEIRMLNNILPLMRLSVGDRTIKNACLESFLMHARNLIDFLEDKRNGADDITCADFLNQTGQKIPAINVPLSSGLKNKINKHLSHITRKRLSKKPLWNYDLIAKIINKKLGDFFVQVSDSYFPTKGSRSREDFSILLIK